MPLSSTSIDEQGNFSLDLPGAPQIQNYLLPFIDNSLGLCNSLPTIDPPTLRLVQAADPPVGYGVSSSFQVLIDGVANYASLTSYETDLPKVNDRYLRLWYASEEGSIKGSLSCLDTTNDYNLNLKAGWNYVSFRLMDDTSSVGKGLSIETSFGNTARWYVGK